MNRILLWIFLIAGFPAAAQQPNFFPVDLRKSPDVVKFEQDSLGVIWMAAQEGLYRYNGFENVLLESSNDSLGHPTDIEKINNLIAVAWSKGSVKIYDPNPQQLVLLKSYDLNASVSDIAVLRNSTILAATFGDGLHSISFEGENKDAVNLIPGYARLHAIATHEDLIALATDSGISFINEKGEQQHEEAKLPRHLCTHLSFDLKGELWFCDYSNNIYHMENPAAPLSEFTVEGATQIFDMVTTRGEVFISTDDGVLWCDTNDPTGSWIRSQTEMKRARALFIDDEYNLWIGDSQTGIWKSCLYIRQVPGSLSKPIQCILVQNDHIWMGTSEGLFLSEKDSWDPKLLVPEYNITCLEADGRRLLAGTYNSGVLALQDGVIEHKIDHVKGLGDNSVLAIERQNETFHIATLYGVFLVEFAGNEVLVSQANKELRNHYVLCMERGRFGGMWYGNHKAGLLHVIGDRVTRYDSIQGGEKIGTVNSLALGVDGVLWIATEKQGLLRLIEGQVKNWHSPHGSKANYTSVVPSANGELLLIGESSVDYYFLKENELISFDKEVGINEMEGFLNDFSSFGGKTWFVHDDNIYVFNQAPVGTRTKVNTIIDRVEVNLNKIDWGEYDHAENENNFSFSFTGVLHRNAEKLFYSYRLEGFDDGWRTTQDRYVSYPKLPPGEYSFQVKATHDEFAIHEQAASFDFSIREAIYNTNWFRFLVVLFTLIIVVLLVRRSRKNLKIKNELIQKRTETQLINLKSQLNPHFMFNSFNTMIGLIEEDPPRGIHFIEYLTDFYRGVLEIGEAELITLSKEIELLKLYVHLLKERHGIGLEVKFDGDFNTGSIPPLSLQMLVENAVKHNVVSPKKPLKITIRESDSHVTVTNSVNLRMAKNDSFGIGLTNIERRYQLLANESIDVIHDDEIFEVKIPIIKA